MLGVLLVRIEHVGSTAIKGIVAKPILDIDLVIADDADFPAVKTRLESLGYRHNGNQGVPEREVFKREDEGVPRGGFGRNWMQHHLYVCTIDSRELQRHVTFRDYLNRHSQARLQYEAIKVEIASRSNGDRKLYAKIKAEEGACTDFVESILKKPYS